LSHKKNINTRKVCILDVDDVLVRFIEGFNRYLIVNRSDISISPKYLPKTWGYTELGDISKEMNTYIDTYSDNKTLMVKDPLKERAPASVFDGAAEFTKKLKELDMEIILLTAHPAHKIIDRVENLRHHGIIFDSIYCTTYYNEKGEKIYKSKQDFAKALGMENREFYFADDKAATVIDMLEKFENANVFTMQRDYNTEALSVVPHLFDKDKNRIHVVPHNSLHGPDQQVGALYELFLSIVGE
jgi:FMN phosphatase YigB (HAD superfamily)